MSLPYENATSGGAALEDIRKLLTRFGCSRFGTMTDAEAGELVVQFTYRGRDVTAKASYRGYAAAWLKEHPWSTRSRCTRPEQERKAMQQAEISVCSILRDWIKGQVMAVETGILTFEGAFLGQILLPNGRTVLEQAAETLLPALGSPSANAEVVRREASERTQS
jgi:hypothetical protein